MFCPEQGVQRYGRKIFNAALTGVIPSRSVGLSAVGHVEDSAVSFMERALTFTFQRLSPASLKYQKNVP